MPSEEDAASQSATMAECSFESSTSFYTIVSEEWSTGLKSPPVVIFLSPDSLLDDCDGHEHIDFYHGPRFGSICKVLLRLLHAPQPEVYLPQITKSVQVLCDQWWNSNGPTSDRWVENSTDSG